MELAILNIACSPRFYNHIDSQVSDRPPGLGYKEKR